MNYNKGPIREFVLGIFDGPHATPKKSQKGHIFLGIKNVTSNGRLDLSDVKYVSDEEFPKWTKRVVPQFGDVVFSYEATLHRYVLIPKGFDGCLGRRMALVRPNPEKLLPRYLHYYFLSSQWKSYIKSKIVIGATVNRIPIKDFPNFEVVLPVIAYQQTVIDTLAPYDDLIENNQRRIQLLEEAARLLYQEWFVHLRFPGHEHVEIVDGVPKGWNKCVIDDVVKTVGGGTPSTKKPEYWKSGTVIWFSPSDLTKNKSLILLNSSKKITELGLNKSSAKLLPPRTILMTSRASIGFFGIYDGFACTNQGFISLIPKEENLRWYVLFNLQQRVKEMIGLAGGTTSKEINKTTFRAMPILVPSQAIIEQFYDFFEDIYKQIKIIKQQNKKLSEARDLLLPRLMNGEIKL